MNDSKLEVKRIFNAPIEKVWDAWTNPKSMMQWKSPESMRTTNVQVDLKVGGSYSVTMEGKTPHDNTDIKGTVSGVYKEIEKPTRLVFTWTWDWQPEATTVTVNLKKVDDTKTEVTLIHEGFETAESKAQHNQGWESTFTKLDTFLIQ